MIHCIKGSKLQNTCIVSFRFIMGRRKEWRVRAGQRREVSVGKMQKSVYVCVCFYMSIEKECYAAGTHLIVGIQRNNTVGRKVKLFLNTAL